LVQQQIFIALMHLCGSFSPPGPWRKSPLDHYCSIPNVQFYLILPAGLGGDKRLWQSEAAAISNAN
jgi:hypothetical protein